MILNLVVHCEVWAMEVVVGIEVVRTAIMEVSLTSLLVTIRVHVMHCPTKQATKQHEI